eukprot:5227141-Ditylum_brightwellii.AAC.1
MNRPDMPKEALRSRLCQLEEDLGAKKQACSLFKRIKSLEAYINEIKSRITKIEEVVSLSLQDVKSE